jgi:hypothetical protein
LHCFGFALTAKEQGASVNGERKISRLIVGMYLTKEKAQEAKEQVMVAETFV